MQAIVRPHQITDQFSYKFSEIPSPARAPLGNDSIYGIRKPRFESARPTLLPSPPCVRRRVSSIKRKFKAVRVMSFTSDPTCQLAETESPHASIGFPRADVHFQK